MRKQWNEGLTKETDIRLALSGRAISKTLTGRKLSLKHKASMQAARKGMMPPRKAVERAIEVNTGKPCSEETKDRIRMALLGGKASEQTREGMRKRRCSEETKQKLREINLGKKPSEECLRKRSESLKGKKRTPERKKQMSEFMKRRWRNPESRDILIRGIMASCWGRPTKAEKMLKGLIDEACPKEYKYTGSGSVIISGLAPDFVNINGQKKVIEMFGTYWHSEKMIGRDEREEENHRKKGFAKFGFSCLIVWERELPLEGEDDTRDDLIRRIRGFTTSKI